MSDRFRGPGGNEELDNAKLRLLIKLNKAQKETNVTLLAAGTEINIFLQLIKAFSYVDPGFAKVAELLIKIFTTSIKTELVDELERLMDEVFTEENITRIVKGGTAVGKIISELIRLEETIPGLSVGIGLLSNALQWLTKSSDALTRAINPVVWAVDRVKGGMEGLIAPLGGIDRAFRDVELRIQVLMRALEKFLRMPIREFLQELIDWFT